MIRTWTPRPLSVGDGIVGEEEGTEADHEADRLRALKATPEQKLEAWQGHQEAAAFVSRVLGPTGPEEE